MTALAADLLVLFRRDLRCFMRELELFPDDAVLWQALPGLGNSAGNLALHVAGNLRHFVGAVLGGSGYVRQREAEFAQREGRRADLIALLETTLQETEAGLGRVTEAQLAEPFPVAVAGCQPPTGRFLLHLATHLAFHLGQVGYLRRALTEDPRSAGGLSLPELMEA